MNTHTIHYTIQFKKIKTIKHNCIPSFDNRVVPCSTTHFAPFMHPIIFIIFTHFITFIYTVLQSTNISSF